MENKISEYMDMEEEFEEMKTKLKYEDGRFLLNDRKDNRRKIRKPKIKNVEGDKFARKPAHNKRADAVNKTDQ